MRGCLVVSVLCIPSLKSVFHCIGMADCSVGLRSRGGAGLGNDSVFHRFANGLTSSIDRWNSLHNERCKSSD